MDETIARIEVEGTGYVLPQLDTLNLNEGKVMKRHSGMTLDQVLEVEGFDPGVLAGLLAIAIQRSDPALREREIDQMVGDVNMFNLMEQFVAIADQMPDPTKGGTPPVADDSQRSSDAPTEASGSSGSDDSEPSPETSSPVSTGVPTSERSATSVPTTSEASPLTS